jgi:hypothetical protein
VASCLKSAIIAKPFTVVVAAVIFSSWCDVSGTIWSSVEELYPNTYISRRFVTKRSGSLSQKCCVCNGGKATYVRLDWFRWRRVTYELRSVEPYVRLDWFRWRRVTYELRSVEPFVSHARGLYHSLINIFVPLLSPCHPLSVHCVYQELRVDFVINYFQVHLRDSFLTAGVYSQIKTWIRNYGHPISCMFSVRAIILLPAKYPSYDVSP